MDLGLFALELLMTEIAPKVLKPEEYVLFRERVLAALNLAEAQLRVEKNLLTGN